MSAGALRPTTARYSPAVWSTALTGVWDRTPVRAAKGRNARRASGISSAGTATAGLALEKKAGTSRGRRRGMRLVFMAFPFWVGEHRSIQLRAARARVAAHIFRPLLGCLQPPMLDLCLTLAALAAPDFNADQRQARMDYIPARQKVPLCYAVGDLEGAQKLFLDAVPEDKRTPAHYLMLGDAFNMLDPEFARTQHAKAFELLPEGPQTPQAWATELQGPGTSEEARPTHAATAAPRAHGPRPMHRPS